MKLVKIFSLLFPLLLILTESFADNELIFEDTEKIIQLTGNSIEILEDPNDSFSIEQVLNSKDFKIAKQSVPNLQISKSSFWAKFKIKNTTDAKDILLTLEYPIIDQIKLITRGEGNTYIVEYSGEDIPMNLREYKHQNYFFELDLPKNETREFILYIKGSEQIQLPIFIGSTNLVLESLFTKDLIFGIYAGIILVMFFYNLFIYFVVKDKTYLFYVSYIISVGLTQAILQGYTLRFFWPGNILLSNQSMILGPSLASIFALLFVNNFLKVKAYIPTYHKILISIILINIASIIIGFFGKLHEAQQIVQFCALSGSILVFIITFKIIKKGSREAILFIVAWSIFLISVIIFVLRTFDILPYNAFTYYSLQIGSGIEVILLSFALADRINILKKEKHESQLITLNTLKENERIIKEQNIVLEARVIERTTKLEETISNLKQTQSKLVDSEKMASLGQLTAGIAHEINNPINFVVSSVTPLKRDIADLYELISLFDTLESNPTLKEEFVKINNFKKEVDIDYLKKEINTLLKGMEEGAIRTSDIVKSLRSFSRLDENAIKKVNLHEGIDSTLSLLNSKINGKIKITKDYSLLPLVECYPGKINQVFMNIINNGIQAIESNEKNNSEGSLTITTKSDDQNAYIFIKDNGIGMNDITKKKIFEPFFTTKDVGKGTGLGLSISYAIIEEHNGSIELTSVLNEGTEFKIRLPIIHN